jgi:hypothetical protein
MMMNTRIALPVLASLLAVPAFADSVHDNYRYSSSTTIQFTAPTESTFTDTANGTLTATSRGSEVKFVFSSEGNICKLTGKLTGTVIRFHANQSCSFSNDGVRFTASLTAGSGTVDEDGALELEIVWSIKGTVQGQALKGTATERTSAAPM